MRSGVLYVLGAAVLWGLLGPLARVAQSEGMAPLEVAFFRASLGGLCFALHALARGELRLLRARDVPAMALGGVLSLSGMYGFFQLAVRAGGAALASVLLYTAPAWVALLSRALFRERMSAAKVLSVGVTIAGAALVTLSTAGSGASLRAGFAGVGWGLASGLSYALLYVVTRRFAGKYPGGLLFAVMLPFAALAFVPFVHHAPHTPRAWLVLAAIAVASTYGASLSYAAGMARLEPTRVAVLATAEPVVTAALSFALFGERFRPVGYLGAALALGGVAFMARAPKEPPSPAPPAPT